MKMNHDLAIRNLRIAEAIDGIELFVVIDDQRRGNFGCRLWDALRSMRAEEAEEFVRQFNRVTAPLRGVWAKQFEDKARCSISRTEAP